MTQKAVAVIPQGKINVVKELTDLIKNNGIWWPTKTRIRRIEKR